MPSIRVRGMIRAKGSVFMDVQYQFLTKLKKLGGNQNHSVLIADIKSKWRKYPGHNVIVLCVKAEYFQTGYECYRANSYTLTPEGREWIQKERDSKISKWAAVIAAVLSAVGIFTGLIF